VDSPLYPPIFNNVLVHSENEEQHKIHLQQASETIRYWPHPQGHQILLGKSQVTYLGHVFTTAGMTPKIQAVRD